MNKPTNTTNSATTNTANKKINSRDIIVTEKTDDDGIATHFYFNGQKTNLYYFNPCYRFYEAEREKNNRAEALKVIKAITENNIKFDWQYPIDSCLLVQNWDSRKKDVVMIDKEPDDRHATLVSVSGCYNLKEKTDAELIAEVKTRDNKLMVQLINIMNSDGTIKNRIGIVRYPYGYTVNAIN